MGTKVKISLNTIERHLSRFYLIYIYTFLLLGALILIGQAAKSEGITRDICLSLGTGLITSFVVSFIFVIADKTTRKIEAIKQRELFLEDFKILLYCMIENLDFDKEIDSEVDYIQFIKTQHRWFHDYYKRIVAKNTTKEETDLRKKQLMNFFKGESAFIKEFFEIDSKWKSCYLTDREKSLLRSMYLEFKRTEVLLIQKSYKRAFLDFSSFLESLSKIPESFRELKSFSLIKCSLEDGKLSFDYSKFYEKEHFLKWVEEFNAIRNENYKTFYAKKSKKCR